MINLKNKSYHPGNRTWRLRQPLILAMVCGGFLSSAHAADNGNIFDTLAKSCNNSSNGQKFADTVLDKYRGNAYPSPKTGGYTITSVNPNITSLFPLAGYCLVKGTIQPSSSGGKDPFVKVQADKVPDINFQVYVPSQWNGKLAQLGGGLFSWPVDVVASKSDALNNYALVLSDAGNVDPQNPSQPNFNAFGAGFVKEANKISDTPQQELVRDFAQDSIKKSLDVGLSIVEKLTGKMPTDKYFVGFSTGGRQAFKAIENWPDAYDGIVSGSPSVYLTRVVKRVAQASQNPENLLGDLFILPNLLFGNWSDPSLTKGFSTLMGAGIESFKQTAINSGANNDPLNSLMNALEPVVNVKPSTVARFLNMPADSSGKKKKVILYQGASDIVVPCTQTGKFVRDTSDYLDSSYKKEDANRMKNSTRVFFIKNFNHGFYDANANGGGLSANLSWNYVAALDQWVHDDNAKIGAPLNAIDPTGNIPSVKDLNSWGCAPSDFL